MTETSAPAVPAAPRRRVWWLCALGCVVVALGWSIWRWRETETAIRLCRAAEAAQQWEVARRHADLWTARRPHDADGWMARAEAARQQQDWEATEFSLGKIPLSDRRFLRSQALRGDLALDALDDPARAIRIWQDLLRIVPSAPLAHQRLIFLYAMTLQRPALIRQIREAIRVGAEPPEAYCYLLTANNLIFSDGYVRVSKWLRSHPDDETLRVAQAVFLERTNPSKTLALFQADGETTTGRELMAKRLAELPQNCELLATEIERAILDDRMDDVGTLLKSLPAAADEESRFWRFRGTWLDRQRRPQEAATAYQRALELHPLDWRSHHELANVSRLLRQPQAAALHAELGRRGKQLEQEILELPNAAQADESLLRRVMDYARDCGDTTVAEGLKRRLAPGTPR